MKKNLGVTDRIIRFVLMDIMMGLSLAGIEMPQYLANTAFMISFYLVVTLIAGYSPLYHLLGLNTRA